VVRNVSVHGWCVNWVNTRPARMVIGTEHIVSMLRWDGREWAKYKFSSCRWFEDWGAQQSCRIVLLTWWRRCAVQTMILRPLHLWFYCVPYICRDGGHWWCWDDGKPLHEHIKTTSLAVTKGCPHEQPPRPVSLSSPRNSKPPIPYPNPRYLMLYLNHWVVPV